MLGRVIVAAANMRTPKAVGLLRRLANHKDSDVRLWTIGALARFEGDKRDLARPILEAAKEDKDAEVAKWAAEALARWAGKNVTRPTTEATETAEP